MVQLQRTENEIERDMQKRLAHSPTTEKVNFCNIFYFVYDHARALVCVWLQIKFSFYFVFYASQRTHWRIILLFICHSCIFPSLAEVSYIHRPIHPPIRPVGQLQTDELSWIKHCKVFVQVAVDGTCSRVPCRRHRRCHCTPTILNWTVGCIAGIRVCTVLFLDKVKQAIKWLHKHHVSAQRPNGRRN